MKYIKDMPFYSVLGEDQTDCGLWQSDENICELKDDPPNVCDHSGLFYGTTDSREPKFCARHFYQHLVAGDGETNYKLVDE
jgi:hypothetical protein